MNNIKQTFEYKPIKDNGNKTIINERCACGALMTEHEPRFSPGHGPCERTGCAQFTWDGFVYAADLTKDSES